MATINLLATAICAGGNHLTLQMGLNGAPRRTVIIDADSILSPITDDDIEAMAKVLLRVAKIGRTAGQVKTALQNGIDVVVP